MHLDGNPVSLDTDITQNEDIQALDFRHSSLRPPHSLVKALIWHQTHFFPLESPQAQHEWELERLFSVRSGVGLGRFASLLGMESLSI